MEMVLRGAERFAQGIEVADGQVMPPMKSFMDDITDLTGDTGGATKLLTRLERLIQLCLWLFCLRGSEVCPW